jgi:hypothetical protein
VIAADQQDRISQQGTNLLKMNPESLKMNKRLNISQIQDLATLPRENPEILANKSQPQATLHADSGEPTLWDHLATCSFDIT